MKFLQRIIFVLVISLLIYPFGAIAQPIKKVNSTSAALTIRCSGTNISCNGGADGSASVTVITGNPPYTYAWSNGDTNPAISGLTAAPYTVTVTDASSGTASCTYTVTEPTPLTVNCSGTNSSCAANTGSVSVAASGGTAPYTYSWNNVTTSTVVIGTNQDNTIYERNKNNSNGAGQFMFAGKLNNGFRNRALLRFNLSSIPAGATITGVTLNLNCSNTNGASGPQAMELHNVLEDWGEGTSNAGSPGGAGTAATTNDATWLNRMHPATAWTTSGGTISSVVSGLSVVDGTGPYSWSSAEMAADIQAWVNHPSTNFGWMLKGLETANLQAKRFDTKENSISDNRPLLTITYVVNPSSNTQTGLPPGEYIVTVTDANGCSSTCAYTVTGTITATNTKTNLSACNASPDGTITVTPAGGIEPYNYSWSGETGSNHTPFTANNVSSLTGLNYGYYNVAITDANNCGSVTINDIHVEFAYTVFVTNSGGTSSSCGNTGSILLYGNAGVQPYTYSLDGINYQPTNSFTGLAAGTYTGYIKDAGGCVGSKPGIVITAAAPITVSPFARAASSCANDGSIEIYRSGGIPPYTYSLNNVSYQVSNVFSGLAAGSYTAYVKDLQGCIGSQIITVSQGAALIVAVSKVNTSTCVNDGSIQVNASGGVPAYTYSINAGLYQAGNSFAGLAAGNYVISVKDFKGCLGSINVTINLNPVVVTAFATNATGCAVNDGKIQLFRTGGYGPYTYSLDGNTYQAGTIFTNLAHGTYTGFVKDSKACVGALANIIVGPAGCSPTFTRNTNAVKNSQLKVPENSALDIQVYPNPAKTGFTLLLNGDTNEEVSIIVTDMLGRIIYQIIGITKPQCRFGTNFTPGIYYVQLVQGKERKSLKLVKE